jgi:hypothetical protein
MSTPQITHIKDEKGRIICSLYGHWDGDPECYGKKLIKFLSGFTITKGVGDVNNNGKEANGMGCLTAQLVAHFKTEVGNFYMLPPGAEEWSPDYSYTVSCSNKGTRLYLRIRDMDGISTHEGTVKQLKKYFKIK